jgi:hypothetical protein
MEESKARKETRHCKIYRRTLSSTLASIKAVNVRKMEDIEGCETSNQAFLDNYEN